MTRILAACSPGEVRVAAVAGGALLDYAVWRPGRPDGVGDVHRGRVIARVAALAGCFVALEGEADGFLPDSEGRAEAGALVGVRIVRAAQGGKGPRLAGAAGTAGPMGLVSRGAGPLVELAARYADAAVAVDDAGAAARLRGVLGARIGVVGQAFDGVVADQVAELDGAEVTLVGGGRMRVQPTAALVAIDVDTAGAVAGAKARGHVVFNFGVVPQVAAQIRLRNLSGAILVDFAGLSVRRRAALGPALQAALAEDPVEARLVGFTGLGLAEIVRRRVRPPLHEVLSGAHAAVAAALRAAVAAVRPGGGAVLWAAPELMAAYAADTVMQADLARSAAHALVLRADPGLGAGQWRLAG